METNVLICGTGNGAQCFAALAQTIYNKANIKLLSIIRDPSFLNDLSKISKTKITINRHDGTCVEYSSDVPVVTNDVRKAMECVHMIILIFLATAHEIYLRAIVYFVLPNTTIVGMPGNAGFELQCISILGEKAKYCSIISTESLPWTCRIVSQWEYVRIISVKVVLGMTYINGQHFHERTSNLDLLQKFVGDSPELFYYQNCLALNFMAISMIHPPIMYEKWKIWDGIPLSEEPLFYAGVDKNQIDTLEAVGNEVFAIAVKLHENFPRLDISQVTHFFVWYRKNHKHSIQDIRTNLMAIKTNTIYTGLVHPMKRSKDGFIPNFYHRYMTEDIPFGLVPLKGIAEILDVKIPCIDNIITWGQDKFQKTYLVGSRLIGKDVMYTRAPQAFGVTTGNALLEYLSL